ncbi:hypothetical protein E4T56_gene4733, partial [Termitomyces sp. T112]
MKAILICLIANRLEFRATSCGSLGNKSIILVLERQGARTTMWMREKFAGCRHS